MSKKMVKGLSILLMAFVMVAMIISPVFAAEDTTEPKEPTEPRDPSKSSFTTSVDNALSIALTVAQSIGITVAVILLIVVAIKYMSAAPNDKAEIKKHMVVYVIGAVLLLCATGVLQLIKTLGNDIIGEGDSGLEGLKPNITIQ